MADERGRLVFREGALVSAVRAGHWLVLDELNLAPSEVLEALNRCAALLSCALCMCVLLQLWGVQLHRLVWWWMFDQRAWGVSSSSHRSDCGLHAELRPHCSAGE